MRVSYHWLKELIDFPYSPQELATLFTKQGLTVDALERFGRPYDKVVVGELIEVAPHPRATSLSVCRVNVGGETLQIVCGAPGLAPGQRVPVALEGATLGALDIRKTSIRGVDSCGMCCSPDELGISSLHETLLFLDKTAAPGTPFESLLNGEDWLFELDVANNRPDLLNHTGVAREIAAHRAFEGDAATYEPRTASLAEAEEAAASRVNVRIEDRTLCPRYTARVIDRVTVGPSPAWMQARLHRLGFRPINNIVDITNYVLLELGHPLHAFDCSRIADATIVVRCAGEGEKLVTLDGIERTLDGEMLVIADSARPVALAGVMGGRDSEVTGATVSILLESACFSGPSIRRTAKLLELRSEASCRFERGVRGMAFQASNRAAELMAQIAGGTVLRGMVDAGHAHAPQRLQIDLATCSALLGLDIPRPQAEKVLVSLGFRIEDQDRGSATPHPASALCLLVPEHRVDIAEEPDIAEELARIAGYDAIPADTRFTFRSEQPLPRMPACRDAVRTALSSAGLLEAYNPSLVSPELIAAAGVPAEAAERRCVRLENASTQEQSVLRTVLFPGLVRNVQHNIAFGAGQVRLFELGKVYSQCGSAFAETETLGIVLWGAAAEEGIWGAARSIEFHDGVAVLDALCAKLNLGSLQCEPAVRAPGHPGRTARVRVTADSSTTELGWLAELDPRVARSLGIRDRAVLAELNLETIATLWRRERSFHRLPKFPAATRDAAFVVKQEVTHDDVLRAVAAAGASLVRAVKLFDLYQGGQVPQGCKSMAYHIEYRADDRTLTDDEVNATHATIVAALAAKVGAQIR